VAFGVEQEGNNWDDEEPRDDRDVDMANPEDVAAHDEEDYFPQESQLPSDDMYASPPPRQHSRKYIFDGSDDQPEQMESPQLRPEGCTPY
jgi:hypothetical protein